MNAATGLSNFAAVPKDPAKTQMDALKKSIQPKPYGKRVKPRKLTGSV